MATGEEILLQWNVMLSAYPSAFSKQDVDRITANQLLWLEQLGDIDYSVLVAACIMYRASGETWFPTNPGTIRNTALKLEKEMCLVGEVSPDYDELIARRLSIKLPGNVARELCGTEVKRLPNGDGDIRRYLK